MALRSQICIHPFRTAPEIVAVLFRIASYCDTVLGKEFCPSFLCNSEMVGKYPAWRALFFLSANHLSLPLLTTGTQAMPLQEAKASPEKSHVAIRHNTNLVSREILKWQRCSILSVAVNAEYGELVCFVYVHATVKQTNKCQG